MPFKHKASQRDKFQKARYKIKNWKQYNEALRQRGNVTFWFSEEAIANWTPEKTGKPGRPQVYSDTAIETGLMLRQVFHLPLRQTQGFMESLRQLLGLEIPVPHYSTMSDRSDGLETTKLSQTITPGSHVIVDSSGLKVFGAGEWHETKHGLQKRRVWRKLHIAVDEKHQFIASTLTTHREGDPGQVPNLLDQLESLFSTFMADGAYDSSTVYQKIQSINPDARIVIPPPKTARPPDKPEAEMSQRDKHIVLIKNEGREAWQEKSGYGLRNYSELGFCRYKQIIGSKLKARELPRQKTESKIGCLALNKMTSLGMPKSIRIA